jgi:hypothetical protein
MEESQPMGTDPKAEILAQAARLEELIDRSTNIIEKSNALIAQSHRLIRKAKRHDVAFRQQAIDELQAELGRAPTEEEINARFNQILENAVKRFKDDC